MFKKVVDHAAYLNVTLHTIIVYICAEAFLCRSYQTLHALGDLKDDEDHCEAEGEDENIGKGTAICQGAKG